MIKANWLVQVDDSGVRIRRLIGINDAGVGPITGYAIESYRPVTHAVGAIWAAAVTQGYVPPRGLVATENEPPLQWDAVTAKLRSVPISELIADELPDQ